MTLFNHVVHILTLLSVCVRPQELNGSPLTNSIDENASIRNYLNGGELSAKPLYPNQEKGPFATVFGNDILLSQLGKQNSNDDDDDKEASDVSNRPFNMNSMYEKSLKLSPKSAIQLDNPYSEGEKADSKTIYDINTTKNAGGMVAKRPFVLGGYGFQKKPFSFGKSFQFGKRTLEDSFGNFRETSAFEDKYGFDKRPFTGGGSFQFGKRDDDIGTDEKQVFILPSAYTIGKRPFTSGGTFQFGKRAHGDEMEDDIRKRPFVSTNGFNIGKRPFVSSTGLNIGKRPFTSSGSFQFGKRELDSDMLNIQTRPFVFSNGYNLGKRPFTSGGSFQFGKRLAEYGASDIAKRPLVFSNGYKFGKRPFTSGSSFQFGKRSERDNIDDLIKRPFVLSNGYNFAKRPFTSGGSFQFGKRNSEDVKRPLVFSNGYNFGKRPFTTGDSFKFGKRTPGNKDGDIFSVPVYSPEGTRMQRSFAIGENYKRTRYLDEPDMQKRPFVLSGGYNFGKRAFIHKDERYALMEKRPFVFNGGFGVRKRPFVLGTYQFGKRSPLPWMMTEQDTEQNISKRPFVLGGTYNFRKRPFVFGNGYKFGKRSEISTDKTAMARALLGLTKQFLKDTIYDNVRMEN